jgi:hypothetical protein
MLMVNTQERHFLAGSGSREGRLKIRNRQRDLVFLKLGDQPVDKRTELASLIFQPCPDRPWHVKTTTAVLKDDAWNLVNAYPGMADGKPLPQKPIPVVRAVDPDVMPSLEMLNQGGNPGGMPATLSTQTNCDCCHAFLRAQRSWRTIDNRFFHLR